MQGCQVMKGFKSSNLKRGMSYIEVVAALTIFAMFGSSLFFAQNYLFSRIQVAQWQLFADMRMRQVLVDYQLEAMQLFLQKKPIKHEKKEQSFERPDMKISIEMSSADQDKKEGVSAQLQKFPQAKLIKLQAVSDNKETTLYSFLYLPDLEEEEV